MDEMIKKRQGEFLYSTLRRRVRHRDKLWSYIVIFILYLFIQIVCTSSKSLETNKTERTTNEDVTPTKSLSVITTSGPSVTENLKNEAMTESKSHPSAVPTWRPKRENCTPPAIEQFPRPLMGPSARKHGGLIIHMVVAVYAFIALAIVCDDYFVSSLDRICEELKLSPDVAGATFMAAGSSAPELATVVIGVFFAKDDIGVSGVIGSAVFNIMFVISICAFFTSTVSYLNWWPLCRDCFFYAISILLMLFTIYNEKISWGESLTMLIMYGIYCATLHFNPILEKWAQTLDVPCKRHSEKEFQNPADLVTYKTLKDEEKSRRPSYNQSPDKIQFGEPNFLEDEAKIQEQGYLSQASQKSTQQQPAYYKATPAEATEISPLIRPTENGLLPLISWYLTVPIHYMCRKTLPDCKSEKYKNWYPFTFILSMLWISFYSYIMVWMITICGSTMGIPDTVMGLTFVAAGVSVPDALSSLAVVKEGYGDMAVSNAVGSNVFDILICLGLPWFIQTALIKPGSNVNVISRGLTYSTLSLLSTVVFLLVATHLNGWKLDKKYGIILMIWYVFFITFASLYELNVFGNMNPPECISDY